MSEEGDIFTDLLSGLMPHPAKPEVNEEDNVEALVAKPASMNELRSSKHQGENGEMVDVKRSSSPIGVGLAPPPPPLTKSEMEELMNELLRAKLLESMGALTGVLRTCFQKVEGQLIAVNEKCTEINSKVEEVACEQTKSSERMEKEMSTVLQSLKEAGVGLQRVLDKQELVDAHVQLSKYSKDNPDAREELKVQPKVDPAPKVSAKGKDPGDTGGPSEPNPPSPIPTMSTPQQKQEAQQPSQLLPPPILHAAVQPAAAPTAAPVPAQVGPPLPPPPAPRLQQGVMSPVGTVPVPPQASRLAYSEPTPSDHQIQQPYEAQHVPQSPPMDPQHQAVPQPTVPSPPSAQQPLPQGSFLQQTYSQPPQPPHTTPSPQGPPQPSRMQQSQAPMIPPPPGPQQMQWKPAPPQPPAQHSAYPPPPNAQYGQHQMQMPPPQPHFQPPVGGTGPPPPVGGVGYPQHPQGLSSRQPPGQPPQQPQAPPIYGAPPPMMSSHGSSGLQAGVGARTSNQSVPLEKVIDDVTSMGFDRTKVRSVVTDMINQGKSVDLNVVIDRLSTF